ncbi:hypothetical protein H6G89_13475 [Oscillatoria sp. FACHB-1407]|uniref:hypothetical protein n=1 Tax=Oscillatoria sp. FACHB-1407 TaxID=2692847 RepID=UPI0016886E5C|nr:hypothetical protein [Oscillatoria sp. FACHB-1407]MBD2462059.1 hypothetical protein [Oscillatoria sp. FACHB-1407]
MSVISKRSSVSELSQQILEMAKAGVYRESVFEALRPTATKKQIGLAIAHAKQFGLHSVATLRDPELGTYYEVDLAKYQSLQHALHSTVVPNDTNDLVTKVVDATVVVRLMLATVRGLAIGSLLLGIACLIAGQQHIGFGLLTSAASASLIWAIQKTVAHKMI